MARKKSSAKKRNTKKSYSSKSVDRRRTLEQSASSLKKKRLRLRRSDRVAQLDRVIEPFHYTPRKTPTQTPPRGVRERGQRFTIAERTLERSQPKRMRNCVERPDPNVRPQSKGASGGNIRKFVRWC